MKKRSIATVVILSIITCGIYAAVVAYLMMTEMERENATSSIPPVVVLLLFLFIAPVGGALLGYSANASLNQIRTQKGLPERDNLVLWIVLGVIFPVIGPALVQYGINQTIDEAA